MMAGVVAAGTNVTVQAADNAIPAEEDSRDRVVDSEYDDEVGIASVAYREGGERAGLALLLVFDRRGWAFFISSFEIRLFIAQLLDKLLGVVSYHLPSSLKT